MFKIEDLPSLRSLATFEVAARHLSFTRAAEELNSTQPAVSQQVRALESELGVTLFKRIYRGVVLTDEGSYLFDCVSKGFGKIHNGVMELQRRHKNPRINVATDFAFAAFWLLPKLPEFRKLYPEIDIRVITSESEANIAASEVDVAIIFGDGHYRNAYSQLLFQEKVFPVYSPKFLKEYGPISTVEDLAKSHLLRLSTNPENTWLDWKQVFLALNNTTDMSDPVMTFNNYTLLVQAAIAGQGVALGWSTLVDGLLNSGVLIGLEEFSVSTALGYFLVDPDRHEDKNAKSLLVDWLVKQ